MSERLPHPKKLSVEAARDLQSGQIDVPDSEKLRAATHFDPHVHSGEIEWAKTKPERFAILAHLIAQTTNAVVKGEGDEARFISPVRERTAYGDTYDMLVDNLFNYTGTDTVEMARAGVLEKPENKPAIERLRAIASKINKTSENTDDSGELSLMYGEYDPAEERTPVPSGDMIMQTVELMRLMDYHIISLGLKLNAEGHRQLLLDNISVLEDIANKNLIHNESLFTDRLEDERTGEIEYYDTEFRAEIADSELLKEDGKYRLIIKNKNPKPKTGLMGATFGCPASFHIDEGNTAFQKQAIAIINEAYDRGLFGEPTVG